MVPGDGWCLFHAVAIGLNRPNQGLVIMEEVIAEMLANSSVYSGSTVGSLETHIASLRKIGWGDHTEIHAISKIYNRKIEIWEPGIAGIPTVRDSYLPSPGSLKLAYYPGSHYDALVPVEDWTPYADMGPVSSRSDALPAPGRPLITSAAPTARGGSPST